jgi:hypothetical protein
VSDENEWPEKAERVSDSKRVERVREGQREGGNNASVSNGRGAVDQFIAHGMTP